MQDLTAQVRKDVVRIFMMRGFWIGLNGICFGQRESNVGAAGHSAHEITLSRDERHFEAQESATIRAIIHMRR